MFRVHQVKLPLSATSTPSVLLLKQVVAKQLGLLVNEIKSATVVKRSLDARERNKIQWRFTVDVTLYKENTNQTQRILKRFKPNELVYLENVTYPPSMKEQDYPKWNSTSRPVVIGAGPAGLFCAYALALRGARPYLIERGESVENRTKKIETLKTTGILDPESNVLFGEGGAGTFSDGKLTCGLSSPLIQTILKTLVEFDAPSDICIDSKPHIGTDCLVTVLKNMRTELLRLGAEIHFSSNCVDFKYSNNKINSVTIQTPNGLTEIDTEFVFLAIGHSARDTYTWLHKKGVPMIQKPFSVGVRIEHLQSKINKAQYGQNCHPALPVADYKLHTQTPDKRGVYTFCMCPGGEVIHASNDPIGINVNGMSLNARNYQNANSAVLVGVTPEDFENEHPLAGMYFQQNIERLAYNFVGQKNVAPVQRVEDFMLNRPTIEFGEVLPSFKPGVEKCNISEFMPKFVVENLRYGIKKLDQRLSGFSSPDAILTAPETRSSSPLRILRNTQKESDINGLYPIGEGAGYAGGIISAALDGLQAGSQVGI